MPLDGLRQICKECGSIMHKAGFRWSGKEKIQAYQCPNCGHVTTTENFAPTSEGQFDQFQGQQPTRQYPRPQPQPAGQLSSFETYTPAP